MKHKQGGMTLLSFVMVLAVVGFALFIGMKLFPMYQEFYAVKTSMAALAKEPGSGDPTRAREMFFKRMDLNYSESVKPGDLKFDRAGGGMRMTVDYEVRRPLVGNLDIVAHFEHSQDLTGSSVD
ncbi:MAG: DUF4845 domain-containing protein [Stenotrophomonas sp.]|jgi:hypothetical protein|uniref:DUF4845 domain-containing protein n=1 Tax=Stenotrophomonas capsici TaxID=3110230 RepID=A0ABU5V671_9GAMM|nr:DUF4845 domain-containing protein [Stenotrophomonas sp. MH1]MEA5668860.1 DUF4845 domain-containing protein [Stenotrophomonas sp. MH1]